MASHSALAQSIARNAQVPAETNKLARYIVQRAIPNIAAVTSSVPLPTLPVPFTSLIVSTGVGYNSDSAVVGGRLYKFKLTLVFDQITNEDTVTVSLDGGTCAYEDAPMIFTSADSGSILTAVDVLSSSFQATNPQWVTLEGVFKATANGSFGPKISCSSASCALSIPSTLELTEIAQ